MFLKCYYGLKDFKPMLFGEKLWVFPHWLVPDEVPEHSIILDPGFAFGTGQHETTKMCLEWLASHDLNHQTVIDYGCGSGIDNNYHRYPLTIIHNPLHHHHYQYTYICRYIRTCGFIIWCNICNRNRNR